MEVKALRADILFEIRNAVESVKKSTFSLGSDPVISKYRAFVESIGGRSSIKVYPEELLKKALSTGRIPYYNTVVDLVNLATLLTRIPISAVDADTVALPLRLTYLTRDIHTKDFRGRELRVTSGSIVLEDQVGRVVYVYPYRVTEAASVKLNTKNSILIGYGAPGVPTSMVVSSIRLVKKYIENYMYGVRCSHPEIARGTQ